MKKSNSKKTAEKNNKMPKNRFLLIFVCIFVAVVLVFGAVLGIISAAKKSRTVVSFKGVGMNAEVASFFATEYKSKFMSSLSYSGIKGVRDEPEFWNLDSGNGKSYGELLSEGVREYISQVLVMNYLYDRYTSLSGEEKELISTAISETLIYKPDVNNSKKSFDKIVEKYGFSYSSYKDAVPMSYKYMVAESVVCGEAGENLKGESDLISEYLSEYTHVKLLFIRTETTFILDENGKRVVANDGKYATRVLTEEEKIERQALLSEIRSYIDAVGTNEASMGADLFNDYLSKHDEGDPESRELGYYFHPDSAFSRAFDSELAGITETAYAMSVNDFGEAEIEDLGVCFIYKYAVNKSDIEEDDLQECFSDFYSNLSAVFFSKTVSELTPLVEFNKKFDEIDIIALPHNYIYVPNF